MCADMTADVDIDIDPDTEEDFWVSLRGDNVTERREPRLREHEEYAGLKCIIFPDDTLY